MKKIVAIVLIIIIVVELIAMLIAFFSSNSGLGLSLLAANAITVIIAYFIIRFHRQNKS